LHNRTVDGRRLRGGETELASRRGGVADVGEVEVVAGLLVGELECVSHMKRDRRELTFRAMAW